MKENYVLEGIKVDGDGFLVNSEDWNETVAEHLAVREGLDDLSEDKLTIVRFMRDYYKKFTSFPILSYVCKHINRSKDCVAREFVDPMKAWKIAGLPKPPGVFFVSFDGEHFRPNPFY